MCLQIEDALLNILTVWFPSEVRESPRAEQWAFVQIYYGLLLAGGITFYMACKLVTNVG